MSRTSILICGFAIAVGVVIALTAGSGEDPIADGGDDSFYGDEDLTPRAGQVDCPDIPLGTHTNELGTNEWTAVEVRAWNLDCETAVELAGRQAKESFDGPRANEPRGWQCDPGTCRLARRQVSWALSYRSLGADARTPFQP